MTLAAAGPGPRWLGDAVHFLVAGGLAAALLPPSLQAVREGEVATAWTAALIGAVVLLHTSVMTARRWPVASLAAGVLACVVLLAAPDIVDTSGISRAAEYGPILLPSILCFFPLVYAVSAHAAPPWPNAALAVGLAGSGLTVFRLWGFTGVPIDAWAWWLLLGTTAVGGTVAAWALGRYHVTRAAWAEQVAERVAADERRRIAREMHDVVAHSLAVVVSHAEAGRLVVPNSPERAAEILDTIAGAGREALTEMRGLLGVLRDDNLPSEPQPGLADLPALVDRMQTAGVRVEFAAVDQLPVSPAVGLTVYRVVQEALTNVTRHAGGRPSARVVVAATGDGLEVSVSSDGASTAVTSEWGRGLTGMWERVEAVGGTLEAGPADDGWLVRARMPL